MQNWWGDHCQNNLCFSAWSQLAWSWVLGLALEALKGYEFIAKLHVGSERAQPAFPGAVRWTTWLLATVKSAGQWAFQLCEGLTAIHWHGFIHRDICPPSQSSWISHQFRVGHTKEILPKRCPKSLGWRFLMSFAWGIFMHLRCFLVPVRGVHTNMNTYSYPFLRSRCQFLISDTVCVLSCSGERWA